MLVHATCVAINERGVLLLGPSGAGKSDLALRLCTERFHWQGQVYEARLVADDQVRLERHGHTLVATSPAPIAGLIEARGIGILALPHRTSATLQLAVKLVHGAPIERLPEPPATVEYLGIEIPCFEIRPFEASAAAKVLLACLARSMA